MENTNTMEDQPAPPTDEQIATAEMNGRMQESVNQLGQTLVKKFQLNGNSFNALELELKVLMLVEQIQLVAGLLIEMSAGKHSDATITEMMIVRVNALSAMLQSQFAAPQLILAGAGAIPPRAPVNGGKH